MSGDLNPMEQDICESTNVSGVKMDDDLYRRGYHDDERRCSESRGGILTSIKNSGCIPSGNGDNTTILPPFLLVPILLMLRHQSPSTNLQLGSMKINPNAVKGLDQRKQAAVQKLQTNSRGMLARRNLGRIKRQTGDGRHPTNLVRRNRNPRNQRPPRPDTTGCWPSVRRPHKASHDNHPCLVGF